MAKPRRPKRKPRPAARGRGGPVARRPPPARSSPPRQPAGPRRPWLRWVLSGVVALALIALVGPVVLAVVYRFVPPPITILMIERLAQGQGLHKQWTPIRAIAPSLVQSVIAAEDAQFCNHHGFDFHAMQAAAAHNERHPGKVRGGSTLSQQTAKNVFLWPGRSYVRKGLEAYDTVLIEAIWGKRRILEMYLNEAEWGPGVYGAQAAAERYFGHDADSLTPVEASRLAAILPDPLKWKAVHPGRYVAHRSAKIVARAATVRNDDLAACVLR
ncbi:MAG: monofunctional biosynthetic peptidoglycan transglycosylase [Caulobacteraceae bacterium]